MKMTFEDLDAWQKARELVNRVYAITRNPAVAKDYGVCEQIQRAAVSIMSNIAEGFERQHGAEKLQAYNIARASCGEVRSLLYVLEDNYVPTGADSRESRPLTSDVGAMISGLIASTRKRLVAKAGTAVTLLATLAWAAVELCR